MSSKIMTYRVRKLLHSPFTSDGFSPKWIRLKSLHRDQLIKEVCICSSGRAEIFAICIKGIMELRILQMRVELAYFSWLIIICERKYTIKTLSIRIFSNKCFWPMTDKREPWILALTEKRAHRPYKQKHI